MFQQNGNGLFSQGAFTIDPNATPEQLKRKRAQIQAMLPRYGQAQYTGQGLTDLARGIMDGIKSRKLDKFESEKTDEANSIWGSIFSGAQTPGTSFNPTAQPAPPVSVENIEGQGVADDTMKTLIRQKLVERGMEPHTADAFILNFQDESGLNPGINEANPIVPGSRGGFGLAQWTGPRRRELEEFAATQGKPASDLDAQLDFLVQELQGSESKAGQSIMSAPDTGTAAQAIVNQFLRPAEEHRQRRSQRYAQSGGGTNVQRIAQAMGNPYIANDPGKMAVLQALMGQAMAKPKNDPTSLQKNVEWLMSQGMPMEQALQMSKGGVTNNINTGGGAKPLGTDGQILVPDENAPGKYRVEVAPNSKLDRERRDVEKDNEAAVQKSGDMVALIDSVINDPALDSIIGNVQGRLPPGIPGITGGQVGMNVAVKIRQIGGKAFLEAFETLKGGGQITEREGQAAKDAIARLETAQSESAYRESLRELRTIANRARRRAGGEEIPDTDGDGWQAVGGVRIRVKP